MPKTVFRYNLKVSPRKFPPTTSSDSIFQTDFVAGILIFLLLMMSSILKWTRWDSVFGDSCESRGHGIPHFVFCLSTSNMQPIRYGSKTVNKCREASPFPFSVQVLIATADCQDVTTGFVKCKLDLNLTQKVSRSQ